MTEAAPAWQQGLPALFATLVVPPLRFAEHLDTEACASKLNGYDQAGRRCYVRHDHTMVLDAFDIDECPLEIAVQHERRTAWRLQCGQWLLSVDRIDRLDSCKPRVRNQLQVADGETQLGL